MTNLTIGIGGASRSGKTTLAAEIKAHFEEKEYHVVLLHQDDFVVPEEDIPRIRTEIDWEHPASIDFDRLIRAVRTSQEEHQLTIVDGFLLYCEKALYDLFDMHFFMQINEDEFFKRRQQDRRYGTDEQWYIVHTWNAFLTHGQIPAELNDEVLTLPQNYNLAVLLAMISHKMEARG